MATAPEKIHFIWTGDKVMSSEDIASLLKVAEVAKKSNFEFNFWVDDEKTFYKALNNYRKQHGAKEQDLLGSKNIHEVLGIKLRKPNELLEKMASDKFYQQDNRLRDFKYNTAREMIGLKNYAAASDFLRYETLRQEGGYYLDTDTVFKITSDSRFIAEDLPLGIKANIRFNRHFDLVDDVGNDIIAAIPNHPVIEEAILHSLREYKELDTQNELTERGKGKGKSVITKESYALKTGQKIHDHTTVMDTKRYPWATDNNQVISNRRKYTITSAGPHALRNGFYKFLEEKFPRGSSLSNENKKELQSMTLNAMSEKGWHISKIANVAVISRSKKSWLEKEKPSTKGMSFEDSLPNTIFGSKSRKIEKTSEEAKAENIENKEPSKAPQKK